MGASKENNIRELLNNDKFVEWIINPTTELDLYWNNIMEKEPKNKKEIVALRRMITHLNVEEQTLSLDDKEMMWQNIMQEGAAKKRTFYNTLWFKVISVAAILIPAIIGSFIYFNGNTDDITIDYNKVVSQLKNSDSKNSKEISLILADNSRIKIKSGSEIVYDNEGNLYANSKKIELIESTDGKSLNQLLVPNGKTAEIKLCDGTKVSVNSGSHLIFPSLFKTKTREIYVDGEIFLHVTKNAKRPFVVKTDKMDVQVLGTSFNVSAYKNEGQQSVVLVNGSVAVKNRATSSESKIVPNQMYDYQKESGEMSIKKVDVYDHICWQFGFLHFKSEKLSTVLAKLQRYYDMKIEFNEQETDKIRVSGKLDLKDNLQHVLKVISVTAPIEYEAKQNSLRINVKS